MKRTKEIPPSKVRIGKSATGLGLFAKEEIKEGEYIEYTGDIITTKEADCLKKARYLFEINTKWTINGAKRENLARYINHSCVPNCESVQNGKRIFIKALCTLKKGEELCYDYGEEYVDEFIRPFGCKCKKCLKEKK